MKSVIYKIFSKKQLEEDQEAHRDFVKFSKGVFENRYLLEGKKQKIGGNIKTGAEFVNFLVRKGLENLESPIEIKGAIISTYDLREEVDFEIEKIKQFQGVKQIVINTQINPQSIIKLMDKYPKAFFALSFSREGFVIKIKAKAPKSGKPSNKGDGEVKPNHCSLKTKEEDIVNDLFWDYLGFKEIKVKHSIEIQDIELPKNENDPIKLRENAIRKGVVRRIVSIDGRKEEKQTNFAA